MANYDEFSDLPNQWFVKQTSAYDCDSKLYDLLLTEAYNKHGVPLTYYITTYNTDVDNYPDAKGLFGEDDNRTFVRKFSIMGYYELPKELQTVSIFGIEGLDNFKIYVSKRHFKAASMVGGFPEYIPKEGDVIHSEYNDMFYGIMDVGEEEEIFIQRKHTWELMVEKFKDTKISLTSATSGDMEELIDISDIGDIFDIKDYITSANEYVEYPTSADDITNPVFDNLWGDE